jgi:hypothetical protein
MLKIKDNVDLKELEKFGFKQTIKNTYYIEKIYKADEDNELFKNFNIQIVINPYTNIYDKKINNKLIGCFNARDDEIDEQFDLDTLYDLIKADLVEKVGE